MYKVDKDIFPLIVSICGKKNTYFLIYAWVFQQIYWSPVERELGEWGLGV